MELKKNKPKARCLICGKECGGDFEDSNLHKIRTGHDSFELIGGEKEWEDEENETLLRGQSSQDIQ